MHQLLFLLFVVAWSLNKPFIERFEDSGDGRWKKGNKIYGPYLPNQVYFKALPDHLLWNISFTEVNSSLGLSGLRLILDDIPCGRTKCCKGSHCSGIVSGHLNSKDTYLYGRFKLFARVGYSISDNPKGINPEAGTVTCWTIVYHMKPHNEIAMCWDTNPHLVHFCFWFNQKMHRVMRKVEVDMSSAFFKYEVIWYPNYIKWLVNGKVLHTTKGIEGETIPYLPGTQMLILRPKFMMYDGPIAFDIARLEYVQPVEIK